MSRYQGYVWECGDDYCGCSQPIIDKVDPNPTLGGPWVIRTRLWEGKFRTDFQWVAANNELNRTARSMRRRWHDAYRLIEWPWDREDR